MRAYIYYIILLTVALIITSCSSNTTFEEEDVIIVADPIRFSNASEQAETRATVPSNLLKTGFLVSTYKNFSSEKWNSSLALNTVMDRYRVDYKENRNDWEGKVESFWNYIGIEGQKEKFWDLSAFPYRFHAVAPAHGNAVPDNSASSPVNALTYDHLKISATYSAQTFEAPAKAVSDASACTITPSNADAEPYLVAQMQRDNNGSDFDILKSTAMSDASTNKVRQVPLPFHHLNCKVRFCIFTENLAQTDRVDYIKNLTIWAENLATSATGYEAHGENAWISQDGYSYFKGITVPTNKVELFKYNINGTSRSYAQNDLSLHQSKASAYYFECPDGIMQLPQSNVKLHVKMDIIEKDGNTYTTFHDFEINESTANYTTVDPSHWIAGNIYTYYLHLNFAELYLPIITATCTLTPWEDVSGSLSTDLEQ